MPESNPGDAAVARVVTRHSSEYVLRALQLLADAFGDLRGGIIAQTIITANTAHLDARGGEGWRYAAIDSTPPDALRRPVSIARVADASGLPFETTRRIVQRLIDRGWCERVGGGGVIVPLASLERPEVVRAAVTNVGYVRRLLRDLQGLGLVDQAPFDWAGAGDAPFQDAAVARVVSRISAEFGLRALRLLVDAYGDIRDGILAHTIVTANTAHLDARGGEGWRYAAIDQTPPDELRRPISITRLAESLGLPFETTRRHVRRLADVGICRRVPGGLIVPEAVLSTPGAAQAAIANTSYARKLVRDLIAASLETGGRPGSE